MAFTSIPVIASGGVGTLEHLATLAGVDANGRRFEGVIAGRAIYEQAFTVGEGRAAIAAALAPPTNGETSQ